MSWHGMWDGFDEEMQNAPDVFARKPQTNAEKRQSTERAITEEEANRKYCKPCIYCGIGEYSANLCDYILDTGHRRGCKYGVGCTKRILKEAESENHA